MSMSRVEVKSFEVPVEEREGMTISWRDDGEAMFHDICWKAIIDSYKMENPFALEAKEKEMVKEGWKTAEYYDSKERVRSESVRIAKMLKTAKYAMAFTGIYRYVCMEIEVVVYTLSCVIVCCGFIPVTSYTCSIDTLL